jgi:hypothetical protein
VVIILAAVGWAPLAQAGSWVAVVLEAVAGAVEVPAAAAVVLADLAVAVLAAVAPVVVGKQTIKRLPQQKITQKIR